jgi:thiamine-phosphate pyrophosphorylase
MTRRSRPAGSTYSTTARRTYGTVGLRGLPVDRHLLAWGLRQRGRIPPLWLFTDDRRLPDPRASVQALPRGHAGVVLRHDRDPDRLRLGRDLARICRARRLTLVVAGDARLAARLRAGVHLRGGHWPGQVRPRGFITSSAHTIADLRRAVRAGAAVVFLSPAFPTESHVGAPGLGPLRWAAMARGAPATSATFGPVVAALGGIDGGSIRRLPVRLCCAAGAVGALSAGEGRI